LDTVSATGPSPLQQESPALVSALVVVPYVLDKLRARVPRATATFDWKATLNARRQLLLFEAFVTHQQAPDDVENHAHSVALFAMYYNFIRIHKTLRTTPAMAANVTKRLWEIGDIVDVLEAWETAEKANA
jgi:hypothetical protein